MGILIFFVLMENVAQAQIFKCVDSTANIVYQDKPCSTASQQSEVEIHQLNADIILDAQNKLSDELNRREELKAIRSQQALKEREIIAIEEQARSNEELARSARENTYAIERNAETARYRTYPNYIYNNRPKYRQNQHRPGFKRHRQKSGLNVNISIK